MSHELRTPLNAVIGYSEMLLEDTDPDADPQGIEDLVKIHRAGRHLLGLVNAILDLSKIEAGKMEVFPEAIDVSSMLGNVADRWRRDERMLDRAIEIDIGDGVGEIDADPGKLEQVLDALIVNAVRYAPESKITIIARSATMVAATPRVQILIEDEGPGIAVELMPRLFETFNDFDDSSATKYGGPGLGLPLCHRLCGLMNAQLSVRSAPGEGTSVSLVVPGENPAASRTNSDEVDLAQAA
jgi:signal transduction histidine kinase